MREHDGLSGKEQIGTIGFLARREKGGAGRMIASLASECDNLQPHGIETGEEVEMLQEGDGRFKAHD